MQSVSNVRKQRTVVVWEVLLCKETAHFVVVMNASMHETSSWSDSPEICWPSFFTYDMTVKANIKLQLLGCWQLVYSFYGFLSDIVSSFKICSTTY